MNKKYIVPIVISAIVIIAIVSTCLGGGNKIKLTWEPVKEPKSSMDSVSLNVYVENSGSMDAYMCAGSNLKDAVFEYVGDMSRQMTSCSLFYINSKLIPYRGNLYSFIKDLTPQSFANAGGDRSSTDLMRIFETILKRQKPRSVSVFVSDCIFDIPENSLDYLGRCQVYVKNIFSDALERNPRLAVEIIQMESKFDGYWYCGQNKEYLKNVKRPYYIWVIGDQRYLAELNRKVPVEDIFGGIKAYCAYAPAQSIPFDIDKNTYVINHSGKISVQLLVDLRESLQREDVFKNLAWYKATNSSQVSILSVDKITNPASPYSHVIELEMVSPETIKSESVTFSYPYLAPWVSHSDDTTGRNVRVNINKTTGLMSLVKGVAEAYKASTEYGSVTFDLSNE